MARIGDQLLRESKAAILADEKENGKVEKTAFKRRDLLSLLLRANMSTDVPPNQHMTDEDVLARELVMALSIPQLKGLFSRGANVYCRWA